LPLKEQKRPLANQHFAKQFASLGYPGFASIRSARKRNPVQVLLDALAQDNLEPRLTEALPWLLMNYANMSKTNRDWLLEQARLRNLTNRLGFVITLAMQILARKEEAPSERYDSLALLVTNLKESHLAKEDTLCQSPSVAEKDWLKETPPKEAEYWHLLTDWRPEHLQYGA